MRIAILSPIAWRTPPRHYGPWEQVASNIAEGLVARGIDVTLFATADSLTAGKLDAVTATGYEENREVDVKVEECLHISNLMEKAGEFDLIHNHFDFLPLTWSRLIRTPVVTTIHGFSSQKIIAVYEKYNAGSHYVSISNADRSPRLSYAATVYNGLNTAEFGFTETAAGYLLFFGRIHPHKGTAEAIKIAIASGRELLIAGIIQDQGYFDREVAPFLNDRIRFIGPAGPQQRNRLLGEAAALLHPISFDEPFGMSVAESMLCGTPVIAFKRGAMPELIEQGKTGFLVSTTDEAVKAVTQLGNISRAYCRESATARFSREKMVGDYIGVYERVLQATDPR